MPLTREHFRTYAHPIFLEDALKRFAFKLTPGESKNTRSLLWTCNGKIHLEVGGLILPCQLGLNITVLGSKKLRW